jgi:hypothetical protein
MVKQCYNCELSVSLGYPVTLYIQGSTNESVNIRKLRSFKVKLHFHMEHLPLLGPSLALIFGRQSLGSSKVLYLFIYDPVTLLVSLVLPHNHQ